MLSPPRPPVRPLLPASARHRGAPAGCPLLHASARPLLHLACTSDAQPNASHYPPSTGDMRRHEPAHHAHTRCMNTWIYPRGPRFQGIPGCTRASISAPDLGIFSHASSSFRILIRIPGKQNSILLPCNSISSKYLLPPQRRLRSFLGVTLTGYGYLVEEADSGPRSCPIPF